MQIIIINIKLIVKKEFIIAIIIVTIINIIIVTVVFFIIQLCIMIHEIKLKPSTTANIEETKNNAPCLADATI